MSSFIKSANTSISDLGSPEQRLFIAVLSQAVHDAFANHVPPYERSQAQAWIMSNNHDFNIICECAGRNSSYVLEKIRRRILEKNGWNVNLSMRVSSPRRRRQMKNINKKHLTGNAYYAAKAQKNFKV